MGSVVHPVEQRIAPWPEVPGGTPSPDFDFDETLENAPLAMTGLAPVTAQDIWMSYTVHRRQSVVLSVDTSLSMTGEKLALTAVALAVVLLQFPDDPVGIVAFENEAKVLKRPGRADFPSAACWSVSWTCPRKATPIWKMGSKAPSL